MIAAVKLVEGFKPAFKGLAVIDGQSQKTSATQDGEIISHINGVVNNLNKADVLELSDPEGTLKDNSIENISVKIKGEIGKHLKKHFDSIYKVVKPENSKDNSSADVFEARITNDKIELTYGSKDNADGRVSWKFDANENPDHWNLPFVVEDLKWALIVLYKRHFKK